MKKKIEPDEIDLTKPPEAECSICGEWIPVDIASSFNLLFTCKKCNNAKKRELKKMVQNGE